MTNKSLIFAGIFAAILGNNAFATGENTVTSKSYVDAQDALKQDKIPAAGTNEETPGESVVTYTDTAGTIGERYIYDGTFQYTDGNADELITAGAVQGQIDASVTNVNNQITNVNNQITNINNNIGETAYNITSQSLSTVNVQQPLGCANQECTLWTVTGSAIAHRITTCASVSDCPSCDSGFTKLCLNHGGRTGHCHCVYGACNTANDCPACTAGTKVCTNNRCECQLKANGQTCDSNAECQSGYCGVASTGTGPEEALTTRCTDNPMVFAD